VFNHHFPLAALAVLGAAVPAVAAAPAQPAGSKPAAATQTRTAVVNALATNFKAVDANGDGTLNAAELQSAEGKVQQQRIAAVRGKIEAEFTKLDTNKDGQLSKAEFMAAAPVTSSTPPNGAKLLAVLDKNKDGKVVIDEYRAPILARFDAIDTNKDGVISDAERASAQAKAKR
jgi:Ca2+-binding EF-hand superfamily protein